MQHHVWWFLPEHGTTATASVHLHCHSCDHYILVGPANPTSLFRMLAAFEKAQAEAHENANSEPEADVATTAAAAAAGSNLAV